jgi:hypothetical protein
LMSVRTDKFPAFVLQGCYNEEANLLKTARRKGFGLPGSSSSASHQGSLPTRLCKGKHLLTAGRVPTIVFAVEHLERFRKTSMHRAATVGLCLFLATLFLYNPFQTATSACGSSNINHRASYRATLATSELQHFTPTDERDFSIPATVLGTRIEIPENLHDGWTLEPAPVVHSGQFLRADLWFRPPPAR